MYTEKYEKYLLIWKSAFWCLVASKTSLDHTWTLQNVQKLAIWCHKWKVKSAIFITVNTRLFTVVKINKRKGEYIWIKSNEIIKIIEFSSEICTDLARVWQFLASRVPQKAMVKFWRSAGNSSDSRYRWPQVDWQLYRTVPFSFGKNILNSQSQSSFKLCTTAPFYSIKSLALPDKY